ncbi:hypothetical protein [Aequorivita echinoideorum]|uniref:Uncharacterized protein n=1 Tax=Aequorivita echinoideorum TaxID=1549647 RepID=A0ABS5S6X8_9FLAO|nr:hypothetical protein [Aequorivita echinoideorum]MBT0608174.1 hypothetical protein [Aequorivita echinoideorum]
MNATLKNLRKLYTLGMLSEAAKKHAERCIKERYARFKEQPTPEKFDFVTMDYIN